MIDGPGLWLVVTLWHSPPAELCALDGMGLWLEVYLQNLDTVLSPRDFLSLCLG